MGVVTGNHQHGSARPVPHGPQCRNSLVRSAAPSSVAKRATVMGLGRHGYETAVEGTNGFVCNLDRSWMDQFGNSPEFWNSKTRGPVCYNRQAARTLLPITLIRTRLALAGKSKAETNEAMKAAIEKGALPAPEPGGMAYMLSKQGFLNSRCGNCAPHRTEVRPYRANSSHEHAKKIGGILRLRSREVRQNV